MARRRWLGGRVQVECTFPQHHRLLSSRIPASPQSPRLNLVPCLPAVLAYTITTWGLALGINWSANISLRIRPSTLVSALGNALLRHHPNSSLADANRHQHQNLGAVLSTLGGAMIVSIYLFEPKLRCRALLHAVVREKKSGLDCSREPCTQARRLHAVSKMMHHRSHGAAVTV